MTNSTSDFKSAIKTNVHGIKFGELDRSLPGKKIPPLASLEELGGGLLVIPGRARQTEKKRPNVHRVRTAYEQTIIKKARQQGRPVLAMCAGSWQLWSAYGGTTVAVQDHCNSRMLRLKKNGDVGYNTQIHKVDVARDSMLAVAMNYENFRAGGFSIPVNSVHWLAPEASATPAPLEVTATALRDDGIAPNKRSSEQMQPTAGSVEAFETKYGVPTFGIQWHPEGYNTSDQNNCPSGHINLLRFMAKAGDAFRNKQSVVREFKSRIPLLRSVGFFKQKGTLNPEKKDGLALQLQSEAIVSETPRRILK